MTVSVRWTVLFALSIFLRPIGSEASTNPKAARTSRILAVISRLNRITLKLDPNGEYMGKANFAKIDLVLRPIVRVRDRITLARLLAVILGGQDSEDKVYDQVFDWAYWSNMRKIAYSPSDEAGKALMEFRRGTDADAREEMDDYVALHARVKRHYEQARARRKARASTR